MQGTDIERITSLINEIKDEAAKQILALTLVSTYRMETIDHTHNIQVESSDGAHTHGDGSHHHNFFLTGNDPTNGQGQENHVSNQLTYPEDYTDDVNSDHQHIEDSIIYEKEHPELAIDFATNIISTGTVLGDDVKKMQDIGNDLYTSKETFNNSYGSPWKEMDMLKSKIDDLEDFTDNHASLQWHGEKTAMMQLMQVIISFAIDAKWAMTTYQDNMQRAYDHKYNDNQASITWEDKEKGATTGNRDQNTPGSVNVERESSDPF